MASYVREKVPPLHLGPGLDIVEHSLQPLRLDLVQVREHLDGGLPQDGHELPQLVDVVLALEDDCFPEQFGQDAPDGPEVDGLGVGLVADEYLRSPVGPGGDVVGGVFYGFLPGQVHVCELDVSSLAHEDVVGLEVPVDDFCGVHEVDGGDELVHDVLDEFFVDVGLGVDEFVERVLHVLHAEVDLVELLLHRHDVGQPDDVLVLQELYLPL